VLKERRRLVLMVRETPAAHRHLRTMTALSEMGAIIAPVPAFYAKPENLDDMVEPSVAACSTSLTSISASCAAGVRTTR